MRVFDGRGFDQQVLAADATAAEQVDGLAGGTGEVPQGNFKAIILEHRIAAIGAVRPQAQQFGL
jgi:hypothetical protein